MKELKKGILDIMFIFFIFLCIIEIEKWEVVWILVGYVVGIFSKSSLLDIKVK